ncbi:MAG: hypothetical protein FJX76_09355 [Armatimonadetes bacterium]|nr:hypothetical protein [Armatimonadota bacterium]
MDAINRAFNDLTQMISAEPDARRADVKAIRAHLQGIDSRIADSDERTSGFEVALLQSLAAWKAALDERFKTHDDLAARVASLEEWRKQQAG